MLLTKSNKILTINHRLGRISLNSIGGRDAVLRVHLTTDNSLEAVGRIYGGAWDANSVKAHPLLLAAILSHLVRIGDTGYYYVDERNLSIVDKRFCAIHKTPRT